MKQSQRVFIVLMTFLVLAGTVAADVFEERSTLTGASLPEISFVSYAGTATGAGVTMDGDVFPIEEVSTGIQINKWLALGGFTSVAPLSDFEHARLGISIADRDNSYYLSSGAELLFTPLGGKKLHPMIRLAFGGVSVGYLSDDDNIEGFDSNNEDRFFYGALSLGMELNLSRHINIYTRAGGRFSGNSEVLGLSNGELGGFEAMIGMRLLWKTVID